MTFMPPQANAFFMRSEDPALRARAREVMQADKRFTRIWEPAPGWIAGIDPLPDSPPDPPELDRHGLVFMEGLDVVTEGRQARLNDRLDEIAELVRNAPDRLDELPGDFSFAWFDKDGRNAAFVRSCGGLVPVYWYKTDDRFAVSTRLGDIVRYARATPELDPLTCALWAGGFPLFPDNRSPIEHVQILSRGHTLTFMNESPQLVSYWDPRPRTLEKPTAQRFDAHATRLREILIGFLDRHLHPAGDNLLFLSGGVDSTSLASVAVSELGRKVSTWSLLPPPGAKLDYELRFIEPLLDQLNITQSWRIHLQADTRLKLQAQAPNVCFPVRHPGLCDLPRVKKANNIKVLFGGEFADEICGSVMTLHDWVQNNSIISLATSLDRLPTGKKDLLRFIKYRFLELIRRPPLPFPALLPEFTPAHLQAEYRDWQARQRQEAINDQLPLRYFHRRTQYDAQTTMHWEVATALEIRRAFPFFNREVFELAYDCHPGELVGPGTKRLLRGALAGIAQKRNLFRPDKGRWGDEYAKSMMQKTKLQSSAVNSVVKKNWPVNGESTMLNAVNVDFVVRLAKNVYQFANMKPRIDDSSGQNFDQLTASIILEHG